MRIKTAIYYLIPVAIFTVLWQLLAQGSQKIQFLFSSPALVLEAFWQKILSGELPHAMLITGFEAFVGLFFGMLVGSLVGFLLLYFPEKAKIANFYLMSLSAIPIFAVAPMMIIWFGTDLQMKIIMAFCSTVFIAATQAYRGGTSIPKYQEDFFLINKASRYQKFMKLVLPNAIEWLLQSLKLNCGLSILGAFIGEFIASDSGLGYYILKSSGLYDTTGVIVYVMGILILTICFSQIGARLEKNKLKIVRMFAR